MAAAAQGNVSVLDVRVKDGAVSAGLSTALNVHKRKINSIHFQGATGTPTDTFATSSTDGTVCIWDLRQVARGGSKTKALATLEHQKACHGARPRRHVRTRAARCAGAEADRAGGVQALTFTPAARQRC